MPRSDFVFDDEELIEEAVRGRFFTDRPNLLENYDERKFKQWYFILKESKR